ncbi:11671_t:CDS:2 [Gigaspora margarita]|uniref:11671_t:CDS:1 n=1 Tax=Gigaspora margarita TaxID=4874 RepID=A0ABM8W0R6_GIGMA|nr:11671_t:CDS:2 [Gigaspora margarita]
MFKDKDEWIPDNRTDFDYYVFRSDVEYKNKRLKIIKDEVRNKIKSQFLESDEINKKLPLIKKNIKNVYTSKPFNLTEINKSLSKLKASKTVGIIEIPDDIHN